MRSPMRTPSKSALEIDGTRDLTPIEGWGNGSLNCLQNMRIVGNTQLVWDGQEWRVGLRDHLVLSKLLDQNSRLSSITTRHYRLMYDAIARASRYTLIKD